MKRNIKYYIILPILMIMSLVLFGGCEGDEEEVPHKLTLKCALVEPNKVTYFEHDDLQGAGEYTPQEAVNLSAPNIPSYRFVAWYNIDGTFISTYRSFPEKNSVWNMLDDDTTLIAKYEYLHYTIEYCDDNGLIENPTNPTAYDGKTNPNPIPISNPPAKEGYTAIGWETYINGARVLITELPNVYDEDLIPFYGENDYRLELHAVYELNKQTITFIYDEDKINHIDVQVSGGDIYTVEGNTFEVDYGCDLIIVQACGKDDWGIDGYIIDDNPIQKGIMIYVRDITTDLVIEIVPYSLLG